MTLERLDEDTLLMTREQLLIELNNQIEITSEVMRLDREEIREWRAECNKYQQSAFRWRWSFYFLFLVLVIIAFNIN
jgi:hypothetical protein